MGANTLSQKLKLLCKKVLTNQKKCAIVAVTTLLVGYFGDVVLGSTLSYLDACTVALSVMAQLLMVWRYREQWAMWIAIDIVSMIMFALLGQWSMVAMYIAWTANAFYGWYNWSKLSKN